MTPLLKPQSLKIWLQSDVEFLLVDMWQYGHLDVQAAVNQENTCQE